MEQLDSETLTKIGDYQLCRVIGRGGLGIVYEATKMLLKRCKRWTERHRAVAQVMGIALACIFLISLVATGAIWRTLLAETVQRVRAEFAQKSVFREFNEEERRRFRKDLTDVLRESN